MNLDENLRVAVLQSINKVKDQIIWKPKKAESHLRKRIALGHLPDQGKRIKLRERMW